MEVRLTRSEGKKSQLKAEDELKSRKRKDWELFFVYVLRIWCRSTHVGEWGGFGYCACAQASVRLSL